MARLGSSLSRSAGGGGVGRLGQGGFRVRGCPVPGRARQPARLLRRPRRSGVTSRRRSRGSSPSGNCSSSRVLDDGGGRLLEIGAGPGHDSAFFAGHGLQVVATDLSPAMVGFCRSKGLDAHVMDFLHLDFPAGSFDAVYALNCLLHVPNADLPEVLAAIRAVLRPGGWLFLGVYGGNGGEGPSRNDLHEPPGSSPGAPTSRSAVRHPVLQPVRLPCHRAGPDALPVADPAAPRVTDGRNWRCISRSTARSATVEQLSAAAPARLRPLHRDAGQEPPGAGPAACTWTGSTPRTGRCSARDLDTASGARLHPACPG